MKATLVFLRWKHALPGHRAFSKYAPADPRIDIDRLKQLVGKLPDTPEAENNLWYHTFKDVESAPEVAHIHREFLFMRDYAGFAALFLFRLGITSIFVMPSWKTALIYFCALVLQFAVVRYVAATYGVRFVCTVLAVKSVKPAAAAPRKPKAS